jgi:hypothetical protein
MSVTDPLERAHRLLDAHVASGGYDLWGPLERAIEEAATREREHPRTSIEAQEVTNG